MAIFETWLKSDLKKPLCVAQLSGNLFSEDANGNLIGVEVFDNGYPASFSNISSVHGYIIRADGYTVETNGTLSGNKASIVLPASAYAIVGQVSIVIKVDDMTVGACVSYVYKTTTDVIVDPGSVVPSIAELLAKIGECEAATLAASSAASAITNMSVTSTELSRDSELTVTITDVNGHKNIDFGIPSATPDFQIGTVQTGAAGSSAAASISGTAEQPVLNLTIPQGIKGDTGNDGVSPSVTVSKVGRVATIEVTDGSGTTSVDIEDGTATDEQVADAVTDWLDDHPEATTTVQDGSITRAKLNSAVVEDIDGKAPAIVSESEKAFSHEDAVGITTTTFYGNGYAFKNCRYADRKNCSPKDDRNYTTVGVGITCKDNYLILNGTGTSTGNTSAVEKSCSVPAGNYKAFIDVDANGTTLVAKSFEIKVEYIDDTNETFSLSVGTEDVSADMSFLKDVKKIYIRPGIRNGVVYSSYTMWVGIYPADVVIVDTNLIVSDGSTIDYIAPIADTTIDTMQHESVVSAVVDTKEYIDNHIPTGIDLVYLTPEMYGAVGDDSTDDSAALQACIDDAVLLNKPVRAFGRYKIISTISIDGSRLDMYFNYIRYTGSANAFNIAGFGNKIWIGSLYATSTGAEGINIIDSSVAEATERLVIEGMYWVSSGICIKIISDANHMIFFLVFRIKSIMSTTSDCITSSGAVTEVAVHDARFGCTNGWCFNGNVVKLFNCTMETNCWGGVYAGSATIQNCRAREMMDCLMVSNYHHEDRSGILFKIKATHTQPNIQIHIDDAIYYDTIDLSEAVVPNDGTGENASIKNGWTGYVSGPIIYGDLTYKYGEFILGKEMILHGKDRICVPQFKSVHTISSTPFDLRDATYLEEWVGSRPPYPTKFIINVADCVIYLSPSYCSEGYSEFIVDMTNYMATIYDRRGNVLFNPSNYTNGIYKFSAIVDHTIDDVYQSDHSGQYVYPINSGYCDVWEIEKL